MIIAASTKIRSSDDGVTPKPPLDSDEWLADYRRRLEDGLRKRPVPQGDPEWVDRVALVLSS
jgi:hypothetical protein